VPLFSVVIPVFNRSSSVFTTLESIYNQTFRDFEILVVDDGSTDALKDSLLNYITLSNFSYYFQANAGVSAARNRGAFLSNGEYLVFLDSDDHVTENWLLDYANEIDTKHPDLIYCGINRMKKDIFVSYTDPRNPFGNGVDIGNVLPGSFCIRRSFFDSVGGYDIQLSYGENTELGFRLKLNNPTFSFISAPNLLYTMNENSHGKNERNKMYCLIYTMKKHPNLFNNNREMKIRFLSIAGVAASKCGELTLAKEYLFECLILNPFNLKISLRLFFVLIPFFRNKIWPKV
jgi:glycosyltransferase involved in cell wall biosynthesis